MNTIKSVLAAASVLALSAVSANAQLLISSVTSSFNNFANGGASAAANTSATTGVGSSSFFTGSPTNPFGNPPDIKTGTSFASAGAANGPGFPVSPAPTFDVVLGNFNWQNGVTDAGTSYLNADFNFSFTITTNAGVFAVNRTSTITFDGPILDGANDQFIFTNVAGGTFSTLTQVYNYGIFVVDVNSNDASNVSLGEQASANTRLVLRVLSPVPEPSTYALFGVVALMGMVAVRRFRSAKKVA